jgi:hypothetical protein
MSDLTPVTRHNALPLDLAQVRRTLGVEAEDWDSPEDNTAYDLPEIREGLVVHSGDHLVLNFPAVMSVERTFELKERLTERFGKFDVDVTLIVGAEQIAVIRASDRKHSAGPSGNWDDWTGTTT